MGRSRPRWSASRHEQLQRNSVAIAILHDMSGPTDMVRLQQQTRFLVAFVGLATVTSAGAQTTGPSRTESGPSSDVAPDVAEPKTPGPTSSQVVPPRVIEQRPPSYPESAGANGPTGTVVLVVTVSAQGSVTAVEVVQSLAPEFDEAAKKAVAGWAFAPALLDTKPVAARIRVPVVFNTSQRQRPAFGSNHDWAGRICFRALGECPRRGRTFGRRYGGER